MEAGYDHAWRRLRLQKLAANPFCQIRTHCASKPLLMQVATEVDHIVPIRQCPELRLVWANLQSTCESCHAAKTKGQSIRESYP